ncbi:MAG: dihydrolipoyl dehydrogenase, partial [Elusimicrobiales bacterium]
GDVNGISMLAHSAIRQAEIAAQHIVRANSERFDKNIVPLCIYSWPEYASVGFNTKTAKENGIDIKVKKAYFQALGKAVATMHTEGFIQIIIDENETVIGSQILGGPATEIIHTLAVAVKNKLKLKELKSIIYAHPTMSEIIMEAINR